MCLSKSPFEGGKGGCKQSFSLSFSPFGGLNKLFYFFILYNHDRKSGELKAGCQLL